MDGKVQMMQPYCNPIEALSVSGCHLESVISRQEKVMRANVESIL